MAIWTADDLTAINAAIRAAMLGKVVTFKDRSYTSHDLPDLLALKATIEQYLQGSDARRLRYAAFDKGV